MMTVVGIIVIAIILLAFGFVAYWQYQAGRTVERLGAEKKKADGLRRAKEIDEEVDNLGPADLDRHFQRWLHDK